MDLLVFCKQTSFQLAAIGTLIFILSDGNKVIRVQLYQSYCNNIINVHAVSPWQPKSFLCEDTCRYKLILICRHDHHKSWN